MNCIRVFQMLLDHLDKPFPTQIELLEQGHHLIGPTKEAHPSA